MRQALSPLHNDRGSALLVTVLLVPVLTLFVVFASNVTHQDTFVTVNDDCHREAFYNSDAALYGTAKMIGLIGKIQDAPELIAGTGGDAPGVIFNNLDADTDIGFRRIVSGSLVSKDTVDQYDIEFIKIPGTDIGVESLVDIEKMGSPGSVGGGAEFASAAEGAGAQLQKALYRIRSQGRSRCTNTVVMVEGDYHMIASNTIGQKGI